MKLLFIKLFCLSLILSSCWDFNPHQLEVQTNINNQTKHNLHFFYDKKDYSISDSIFFVIKHINDSLKYKGLIQFTLDSTLIHRDKILNESGTVEYISKIKLFYIQQGDTFNVKKEFYDGKSCWITEISVIDGMLFGGHHWAVGFTATLTDEMFEKK